MSVTFSAEVLAAAAFVLTCGCREATALAPRYATYEEPARQVRRLREQTRAGGGTFAVLSGCEDHDHCRHTGPHVEPIHDNPGPHLNLSNTNAALLLRTLGYVEEVDAGDLAGDADPADFLGRVLTALAVAPEDEGVPWHHVTSRHVDCGRRPGYLQDRLRGLHDLAQWCRRHRRRVQWA